MQAPLANAGFATSEMPAANHGARARLQTAA